MIVELEIYSGRVNPSWPLTREEMGELQFRLAGLPERRATSLRDEPLGYRGLRVVDAPAEGMSLTVSAGTIEFSGPGGLIRQFDDAGRRLECWLVTTAAGRLDESLRQIALADIGSSCP